MTSMKIELELSLAQARILSQVIGDALHMARETDDGEQLAECHDGLDGEAALAALAEVDAMVDGQIRAQEA